MGEHFELTFFSSICADGRKNKKKILELLSLTEGKNEIGQHTYPLFENREVLFEFFEEPPLLEYVISLSDFIITKENFYQKERQLLQIADICLSRIESLIFATGIYELTYYLTQDIKHIESFDRGLLTQFPFVFLRSKNEYNLVPFEQHNDTICVFNTDNPVQNIFSDV